jgi:opacity protein-like surface antigen
MKFFKLMVVALVAFVSVSAMAGRTDAGTWATGFNFMYDSSTRSGSQTTLDLELGYFFAKDNQIGGTFGLEVDDFVETFSVGPRYEFYFDFGGAFVPYIGVGLQLAHADFTGIGDNTALVGELSLGVKLFITENVAVDVAFSAAAATDDIYVDDKARLDAEDFDFTVGFDFCF